MISPSIRTEQGRIMADLKYLPEVAIVLPFQPVVHSKTILEQRLKTALQQVEASVMASYAMQQAMPLFVKLQNLINHLNFYTHRKSIALFVSPVTEKVIYLDFEVEEGIYIDSSFKLADLAKLKTYHKQILLLSITENDSRLYVGCSDGLHLIKMNKLSPGSTKAAVTNDSSAAYTGVYKFLRQLDQGLSILLKSYPYPVFVVGNEKLVEQFTSVSENEEHVMRCLTSTAPDPDEADLFKMVEPYMSNWENIYQQRILRQVNKLNRGKKLTCGLANVHAAIKDNSGLLVLEEGAEYPQHTSYSSNTSNAHLALNAAFYKQDVADEIVEKVVECGGDIECLPAGSLSAYDHIAYLNRK